MLQFVGVGRSFSFELRKSEPDTMNGRHISNKGKGKVYIKMKKID